ncbi:MAG: sodium:proton antiporter [Desulfurococcales archaeon ex4484_58]|nr:MAG: sodium:proton antiporter [Desulfurococcales archaeon ex4484_58]
MIDPQIIVLGMAALAALVSVIATYLAILEKNLVRAVVFSAIQSTLYAFLYYVLMAPDIVLVYIPVAVGLYPAVVLILISKTEKEEKV